MRTKARLTPNPLETPDLDEVVGSAALPEMSPDPSPHLDEEWEDVPDTNLARPANERTASGTNSPRNPRRRKAGKTIFVAQATPSRRFPSVPPSKNANIVKEDALPLIDIDTARLRGALNSGASFTLDYVLDVLKTAIHLLRRPLGLLLFVWLLAALLSRLAESFRVVLSPLCYVPGISRTPFCYTPSDSSAPKAAKWADYPRLMDMQGGTLDQLLDESVGGSGLSLEIKKAELATTDLVTLVKVSDLKSRDLLAEMLEEFVSDAKKTGRGLQKLSSRINGAVDSILAVNDHALHTIEAEVAKSAPSALRLLFPFPSSLSPFTAPAHTKEIVTRTFTDAMSVLSSQIARIIIEAEHQLANLDALETRLASLHGLLALEHASVTHVRDEILAELWTLLGGNKRRLRGVDNHMVLLKGLGQYRARALAHVVGALQTLKGMSADMEEMRERVAAPELVGERIPVEVHLKSIQVGLERLREGRKRQREREEETARKILGAEEE